MIRTALLPPEKVKKFRLVHHWYSHLTLRLSVWLIWSLPQPNFKNPFTSPTIKKWVVVDWQWPDTTQKNTAHLKHSPSPPTPFCENFAKWTVSACTVTTLSASRIHADGTLKITNRRWMRVWFLSRWCEYRSRFRTEFVRKQSHYQIALEFCISPTNQPN